MPVIHSALSSDNIHALLLTTSIVPTILGGVKVHGVISNREMASSRALRPDSGVIVNGILRRLTNAGRSELRGAVTSALRARH